jgi:hypothetical protein
MTKGNTPIIIGMLYIYLYTILNTMEILMRKYPMTSKTIPTIFFALAFFLEVSRRINPMIERITPNINILI